MIDCARPFDIHRELVTVAETTALLLAKYNLPLIDALIDETATRVIHDELRRGLLAAIRNELRLHVRAHLAQQKGRLSGKPN